MRGLIQSILNSLPISILEFVLAYAPKAKTLRYYLAEGKEVVYRSPEPLLGNARFKIDKTYRIERFILTEACYDRESLQLINSVVKENSVCIDAGANIGSLALAMAHCAKQGKVYAFEPGPIIYKRLTANIQLNPQLYNRIEAINFGLSDKEETLYWQENPDNRGNASFNDKDGEALKLTTLDLYFRDKKLEQLDFIKIDVEGMELSVIKGGWELIQKFKPMIYYESWTGDDPENDKRLQEVERILSEIGYQFYSFKSDGSFEKVQFPNLGQNTLARVNS